MRWQPTIFGILAGLASAWSLPALAEESGVVPMIPSEQLPPAEGLWERWDASRSWGTPVLVETLEAVAARVAVELPHAEPLMVGDISRRGGGQLLGHFTHRAGTDVDLGLYFHGGRQPHGGFVDVAPDELDAQATWVLVSALLDTGRVQFILLDAALIDVLRDYVLEELRLDPAVVERIMPMENGRHVSWSERGILRHAEGHRNHMHVTITLPEPERGS